MPDIDQQRSATFIAILTIVLIIAALYIFNPFLKFILVAAVLSLATSHGYTAALRYMDESRLPKRLKRGKRLWVSAVFTCCFLLLIFLPLIYFLTVTFNQVATLDIEKVKTTILDAWVGITTTIGDFPYLESLFSQLKMKGSSIINGSSIEALLRGGQNMITGAGSLVLQVTWILIFYFLFNLYGHKILHFLATLMPTNNKHEQYLYKECTGTVAVVFYGSLFNMIAQGFAFGILMLFIGDYDSLYLGVLAGFCSIIPLLGAALVYIPVVVLEFLEGNYFGGIVVIAFSWIVMGFLIDNLLRMLFIGFLKKLFRFQYTMNEVLILLSILAGISTIGFWGLVIGPSVTALAIASANLYRDHLNEEGHTPQTGC